MSNWIDENSNRLELETQAEFSKILYNFAKQINEALESGDPIRIMQIMSAYVMYTETNAKMFKMNQK